MSRSVFTHEHHNCGDQLIHLHLVRALAKQHDQIPFVHFCSGCHHENLREVVADLPNVLLVPFESPLWQERQHESIGVWKNENDRWVNSRHRWDWSLSTLELHKQNAERMGFESPFKVREHLLFDYPALEASSPFGAFACDFLIGDSAPSSGQYSEWADHSKDPLASLINALLDAGHSVNTTSHQKKEGWNISQIGAESLFAKHHIMVANAPFFCTLNTTNHHYHEDRKRIALLSNGEQLSMPYIQQCATVDEVMRIAKEEKWI